MPELEIIERIEDMSPTGFLRLILQEDGDIIVAVVPDPEGRHTAMPSVEFCMPSSGGGRSRNTLKALRQLAEAMKQDNSEHPISG